ILGEGASEQIGYEGLEEALEVPSAQIRLFGKPEIKGRRRLGVALATGDLIEEARLRANKAAGKIRVKLG
ncbi:phosphoribosylglycinamide formyltransferase 2, partial [bacterium AH-315-L15]|nr:phosphoribosylglycinamide formyltransferase 2 [bacterium AH-315-L15]